MSKETESAAPDYGAYNSFEMMKRERRIDLADLRDTLTCPICLELFTHTVDCPNGHTICRDCFDKLPGRPVRKCPQCRVSYAKELPPNGLFQKMMSLIKAGCRFPNCKVIVSLSDMAKHEEDCEFNDDLICPFASIAAIRPAPHEEGCHDHFIAGNVFAHLTQVHHSVLTNALKMTFQLNGPNSKSFVVKQPNQLSLLVALFSDATVADIVVVLLHITSKNLCVALKMKNGDSEARLEKQLKRVGLSKSLIANFRFDMSEVLEYAVGRSLSVTLEMTSK